MRTLQRLRALSAADALSVGRDSLLRGMAIVPLALAAATRWLLPEPARAIGALLGLDLVRFYGPVMGYALLLLAPVICGMIVGFLLLDQRDDRTLTAIQVSPLPLTGYLAYRLAAPMLLSLVVTLVALPLSGVAPIGLPALLLCALVAAPLAPLGGLFLASFASNKVQGIALQKAMSILVLIPALAFFLPSPWGLLCGIAPSYWPAIVLWQVQAGSALPWVEVVTGVAYQALLLALLLRRFGRVMYQ